MTGSTSPPLAVLAAIGTDVHRFDRLMDWLEGWYRLRADRPRVIVQHGRSRTPAIPGATPFLPHDALTAAMAEALVVVTHGGPASITEARQYGHVPIVVARDPAHGEHVDDHQMLFAARMAERGLIRLCGTPTELSATLEEGLADPTILRTGLDGAADPSGDRAAAVARVGRIVDDLVAARRRPGRRRG